MRQASDKGLEFIRAWEGESLAAYRDPAGLLTIGVGHLLTKDELTSGKVKIAGGAVKWRRKLTTSQSALLLDQDLDVVEEALSLEPYGLSVTQEPYDALCSFVFNVGREAFRASTLRKRLLASSWKGARDQFKRWVWAGGKKVPGLARRRAAEAALFWKGEYGNGL